MHITNASEHILFIVHAQLASRGLVTSVGNNVCTGLDFNLFCKQRINVVRYCVTVLIRYPNEYWFV